MYDFRLLNSIVTCEEVQAAEPGTTVCCFNKFLIEPILYAVPHNEAVIFVWTKLILMMQSLVVGSRSRVRTPRDVPALNLNKVFELMEQETMLG
jgi:hypothetical protein